MHLLKNIFSNNKNIGQKFEFKLLKKYGKCNELKNMVLIYYLLLILIIVYLTQKNI